MTLENMKFNHGDEVLVMSRQGEIECRGIIVARSDSWRGHTYDIQVNQTYKLCQRKCGIREDELRLVPKSVRAYERRDDSAKHIKDHA
jgi:hypothetical protein